MVAPFRPVSKTSPCQVCGGDHKCSTTADGLLVCGRSAGPVPGFRHLGPCKDPQWHKYRADTGRAGGVSPRANRQPQPGHPEANASGSPPDEAGRAVSPRVDRQSPPGHPEANAPGSPDLDARATGFAAALTDRRRWELAARLGLPEECLLRLPGLGYSTAQGAWTFPEVNAAGAVVGVSVRFPDGAKRTLPGGHRGLTVPGGVLDDPGPLFLVEGPTDVLALCAVGLAAVGRPSNTGGVDDLTLLLQGQPADRPVVVVGENDRKPDGLWPGRDGAFQTAAGLAARVGRAVRWAMPPDDYKDVRAWVSDRLAGQGEGFDPEAVGRDLAAHLLRVALACEPPGRPAADPVPSRFPPPDDWATIGGDADGGANWVWDGLLARECVTLLSALPKAGKTTLLTHLLAALPAGGSFCGRSLAPGRAFVVSEEPAGVWKERRQAFGLPEGVVRIYPREKSGGVKGGPADWAEFLHWLRLHLDGDPADLVVIDTLAAFWPVRDENSAAEVQAALTPLHKLCNGTGRAVLLVHHLRKSDGDQGTGSRGSGAIAGFVDVIAELRRAKPDPTGRRRVLTGYGRFAGIPADWPIEWAADGTYRHCPEAADSPAEWEVRQERFEQAVLAVLPDDEAEAITTKGVWDRLPAAFRLARPADLNRKLNADGVPWLRSGGGRQGAKGRYWKAGSP